jgi:hypothetical protein
VTTDDSFLKILDDATSKLGSWLADAESQMSDRLSSSQGNAPRERVADLLDELARRLRREPPH